MQLQCAPLLCSKQPDIDRQMKRGGAVALAAPQCTPPLRRLVGCPRRSTFPITSCRLVSSPPSFEYLYYDIAIYVLLALGCAEELFSINL